MTKITLALVAGALLSACVTTKEANVAYIEAANWQGLGEYHGHNGLGLLKEDKLVAQAGGQAVDYAGYKQAYQQALAEYCHPEHTFQLGLKELPYNSLCDQFPFGVKSKAAWDLGRGTNSSL